MEFVNSTRVELIKTNATDEDVARAAWVSNYGEDAREKEAGKIEGLINYLYTNAHMSPFEHGSFTFFVDCPLFVRSEFHRHRTFSYNEVSGRYSELKPRFYVPPVVRPLIQQGKVGAYNFTAGSDEQYAIVRNRLERNSHTAWGHYQELIGLGVAREVARDVLPLNLMTQFYATVNPRNLMQFLTLRDDDQALWEIRTLAVQMDALFKDTMPLTHKVYRRRRDDHSTAAVWEKLYQDAKQEIENLKAQLGVQNTFNINLTSGNDSRNPRDILNKAIDELNREKIRDDHKR